MVIASRSFTSGACANHINHVAGVELHGCRTCYYILSSIVNSYNDVTYNTLVRGGDFGSSTGQTWISSTVTSPKKSIKDIVAYFYNRK